MAFDYGSIDLGLRNPFRLEGAVTATRGLVQTVLGGVLIMEAAASVRDDAVSGWILMAFGILLIGMGLLALGGGTMAMLRYFVGRNHPTSLAANFSRSEASTAEGELEHVAYYRNVLEEMLVGRKNATFREPQGFLARLLHTFVPKLLFMPYPVRNMAQRLFGAWVRTLIALIAFGFVAFVSLAGFAGEAGAVILPVYAPILLLYLTFVWRTAGRPISRAAEVRVESLGSADLMRVIVMAVIVPVSIGLAVSAALPGGEETRAVVAAAPDVYAWAYVLGISLSAIAATVVICLLIRPRLALANPVTEVSELRENWQESVHPNEIFINLDNLVMAKRRYREVPNRVYWALEPELQQQVEGKGDFTGQMIQEVQPSVRSVEVSSAQKLVRLISLIAGNTLFCVAALLLMWFAAAAVDIATFVRSVELGSNTSDAQSAEFLALIMTAAHLLVVTFLVGGFARLFANAAHLFFAEIQFDSLLVYFRCEGTFTESKISTGTGIHDSTRSENTLVRSSITPWIIVTRIVSSTFAATGMDNLEHPRYVLEMHTADRDMEGIRDDVISFLKNRESIAAITNERDLGNASQIYQLNQQTRAQPAAEQITRDTEAAGYLRQESELNEADAKEREDR